MKREKTTAIILAAGYSSRMGNFKPLLKLGETTVLERVVGLFREAGIEDVRVVVGHRATDLAPVLEKMGVRWILNERYDDGMISSVKAGVQTLEADREAFFLLPVDIPLVRTRTLLDLVQAWQASGQGIVYPTFLGKRGHPPLISARHAAGIVGWDGSGGLRTFLAEKEGEAANVEVADEHIALDIDTPSEYQDLLDRWENHAIPSASECMILLTETFSVRPRVVTHSRAVARLALHLGQALNRRGCRLNTRLIVAAGLLHDIARGQPDHASTAARILRDLEYPAVAEIVEAHMGSGASEREFPTERHVVCLADKLVQGDRIVSLEARFRRQLDRYGRDSAARAAIAGKLAKARTLKRRIEETLGEPIDPNELSEKKSGENLFEKRFLPRPLSKNF